MWRQTTVMIALFCLGGCAGQVEEEPDAGDDSGGASSSGASEASETTRLGECTGGTAQAEATECLWLADGICYWTRADACNCICPTNVAKVDCLSDFPEDGIPTEVYCM